MTQILLGAHRTGEYAFLASDSRCTGTRDRHKPARKVFCHPGRLLIGAAGHAQGILSAIDACLHASPTPNAIVDFLEKEWNEFAQANRTDFARDPVMRDADQLYYLVYLSGSGFEYQTIQLSYAGALGINSRPDIRTFPVERGSIRVFGPVFDHNNRTAKEYEFCGASARKAVKAQSVSSKSLDIGLTSAIARTCRIQPAEHPLVGLPMTGWLLRRDGQMAPLGDLSIDRPGTRLEDLRMDIKARIESIQT